MFFRCGICVRRASRFAPSTRGRWSQTPRPSKTWCPPLTAGTCSPPEAPEYLSGTSGSEYTCLITRRAVCYITSQTHTQWNLSIKDTLGPQFLVLNTEVSSIQWSLITLQYFTRTENSVHNTEVYSIQSPLIHCCTTLEHRMVSLLQRFPQFRGL